MKRGAERQISKDEDDEEDDDIEVCIYGLVRGLNLAQRHHI